jgi:hypothetical protein
MQTFDTDMNETFAGRHSMDTPEWYTPAPFVEAARTVMGGIDLDPASHREANKTIMATDYYTEAENGLQKPWSGRVFLNPPGGLVCDFWERLMCEHDLLQHVQQAIWIGYSLEQLQSLQTAHVIQAELKTPLNFSMCVPRRRIAFVENEAKRATRLVKIRAENEKRRASGRKLMSEKSGPSHANYVTYMGHRKEQFRDVFSAFGQVVIR